jgi:hypothetical protein
MMPHLGFLVSPISRQRHHQLTNAYMTLWNCFF